MPGLEPAASVDETPALPTELNGTWIQEVFKTKSRPLRVHPTELYWGSAGEALNLCRSQCSHLSHLKNE